MVPRKRDRLFLGRFKGDRQRCFLSHMRKKAGLNIAPTEAFRSLPTFFLRKRSSHGMMKFANHFIPFSPALRAV